MYFPIAKPIARTKKLPPELANEATFLAHLKVTQAELKKIWWYRHKMYHRFSITNAKGKVRKIDAPDDRLKHLQRCISALLDKVYNVRNPVHGFVAGKSVKTNANSHVKKRFIVNLDIKNFFPSITENRVKGVLSAQGIDARVSEIIARICTLDGKLPQGAPSSPVLSNMICFRLDKQLQAFAKTNRSIYTRYADDITFSGWQPLSTFFNGACPSSGHFSPDTLVQSLQDIFKTNGFSINPDKAHYADRHSRRTVTGLKVNEFVNVDRRFIRNIRSVLNNIEKHGLEKAQATFSEKFSGTGKTDLGAHLNGKISWLGFIRGQYNPIFRKVALRFNNCFPEQKISLPPTWEDVRDKSVWVLEDVEGGCSQGTAFFLKDVGLVTAAHCLTEATEFVIFHTSKPANRFEVQVEKMDEHRDLAILSHGIPTTEYLELKQSVSSIEVSDKAIALGFPGFAPGDGLNTREGTVSSLPIKRAVRYVEVTQKLTQGMSGGPIINQHNEVIGITHKGGPDEGRDLAVKINELTTWIKE